MNHFSVFLSTFFLILVAGCGSFDADLQEAEPDGQMLAQLVETVSTVSLATDTGSRSEGYRIEVRVRQDESVLLPDAIRILAHQSATEPAVLYDDGLHDDGVAGDGLFAGTVPEACMPETSGAAGKSDVGCKIKIVGPGEKCGNWGTCPRRASRSFLWGLIEYETEVVLCFCIDECEIGD